MSTIGSAELHEAVRRLVPMIVAEGARITDAFALKHQLHRTDADALSVLMAADAEGFVMTTGALGGELGITSGATTFAVNRLERAGLVERNRDHEDQRRILLALSKEGRDLANSFYSPIRERSMAVLAEFTELELQIVHKFLSNTVNAMTACRVTFEES